jgi:hypothetical protein
MFSTFDAMPLRRRYTQQLANVSSTMPEVIVEMFPYPALSTGAFQTTAAVGLHLLKTLSRPHDPWLGKRPVAEVDEFGFLEHLFSVPLLLWVT